MQDYTRAVVIGGGVVGCSVLYHLARAGWQDILLIERSELTSGSSWHAAGSFHMLNSDINISRLQAYTINLYPELEEFSGQSCGLHVTGGLLLAGDERRMDFLKSLQAKSAYLDTETHLVSPTEAAGLLPLIDPKYFVGALWNPSEGDLDPSGTTNAYAKAAQKLGAKIELRNPVREIKLLANREWELTTANGKIRTEHIINAGGLWAREIGRMVGVELPIQAMEHMYVITDEMAEVKDIVANTGTNLAHAIDLEGELYLRQEQAGILVGAYEKKCVSWSDISTPWDFGHDLLAPDIDRISPSLEIGFKHFPALQNAGINKIINGPLTFSPDGNPLVGPLPNLPNFWCACAVMGGFSQGGGVGLAVANWLADGDPGFDVWGMDVARFGTYANPNYTRARVKEYYSSRFKVPYPNQQPRSARPLYTTPLYHYLKQQNAVFGVKNGLEQPLWFQKKGLAPVEELTFRRSNAFAAVGDECRLVRDNVGVSEISGMAKYNVFGPNSKPWLDKMLANTLPDFGRLKFCPMLDDFGNIIANFTVAAVSADNYLIFADGAGDSYHMRWFNSHIDVEGVFVNSIEYGLGGLVVAGPGATAVLDKASNGYLSSNPFNLLDLRQVYFDKVPVYISRNSFTGSQGYELWCSMAYLNYLFDIIMAAGKDYNIGLFGGYAMDSLRLEKSFGTWAREYRPVYNPFEAGLDSFVAIDDKDFIGKAAIQEHTPDLLSHKLVTLVVNSDDIDAIGDEPIYHKGTPVGWVTSGGYGHYCRKSIAMGYIENEIIKGDPILSVKIIGQEYQARLQPKPLYDPEGLALVS